jgi:hypothetical protein
MVPVVEESLSDPKRGEKLMEKARWLAVACTFADTRAVVL